jgi:hypothetical protein
VSGKPQSNKKNILNSTDGIAEQELYLIQKLIYFGSMTDPFLQSTYENISVFVT